MEIGRKITAKIEGGGFEGNLRRHHPGKGPEEIEKHVDRDKSRKTIEQREKEFA